MVAGAVLAKVTFIFTYTVELGKLCIKIFGTETIPYLKFEVSTENVVPLSSMHFGIFENSFEIFGFKIV